MAFGNLTDKMVQEVFDIAVVDNNEFSDKIYLKETLKEVSNDSSENYLFNIKYVDIDDANELLENEKIEGYIYVNNNETKLIVRESGFNQTIIKYVIDEVNNYQNMVTEIVTYEMNKGNMNVDYNAIINRINNRMNDDVTLVNNQSKKNLDVEVVEFYTLIAMACMYGSIIGLFVINNSVANVSKKAARVNVAPIKIGNLVFSGALAGYLVIILEILLLILYTSQVLGIDYGSDVMRLVLISLVGGLAGLSVGMLLGTFSKLKATTKEGISISLTMFGSFFAGMYGMTMKYIVDTNMPLINKINPVAMITDGLYSLYYYSSYNRYYFNVISLLIFSLLMILLTCIILRRKKYDYI